jgi:hypothetical protein
MIQEAEEGCEKDPTYAGDNSLSKMVSQMALNEQ